MNSQFVCIYPRSSGSESIARSHSCQSLSKSSAGIGLSWACGNGSERSVQIAPVRRSEQESLVAIKANFSDSRAGIIQFQIPLLDAAIKGFVVSGRYWNEKQQRSPKSNLPWVRPEVRREDRAAVDHARPKSPNAKVSDESRPPIPFDLASERKGWLPFAAPSGSTPCPATPVPAPVGAWSAQPQTEHAPGWQARL